MRAYKPSNFGEIMHNKKIENLKKLLDTNEFLSLNFNDIIAKPNCTDLIKDLIFLVGYNNIEIEHKSSNNVIFKAGMFVGDLDEKLHLKDNILDGKLLLAIETVFNVLLDIQRQSNILELYPRDMRNKINSEIEQKNNINSLFFNNIKSRMIL